MASDAEKIADNCFRLALADATWQTLGYKGLPKQGILPRLFKARWRQVLEIQLLPELLAFFTAAHLLAFDEVRRPKLLDEIVDVCWGNDGRLAAQFPTKDACRAKMAAYAFGPKPWTELLIDNLSLWQIQDKKSKWVIVCGCSQLTSGALNIQFFMLEGVEMAAWRPLPTAEEMIREAYALLDGDNDVAA